MELLHPLNAFKHTIKCRKTTFMPNVLRHYYITVGKENKISDNDVNQLFLICELQAPRGPWGYSKGSSNITGSVTCIPHMLPFLKWLYLLRWWIHLELVWKSCWVHKILFLCSHYLFSKWSLPVKQSVCSGQHSFLKLSRGPYTL